MTNIFIVKYRADGMLWIHLQYQLRPRAVGFYMNKINKYVLLTMHLKCWANMKNTLAGYSCLREKKHSQMIGVLTYVRLHADWLSHTSFWLNIKNAYKILSHYRRKLARFPLCCCKFDLGACIGQNLNTLFVT